MEPPFPLTHAVTAKVHIWHQEKLLILKRHEGDDYLPGYWDLPGGDLKPGETAFEGARRETREETGLALAKLRPINVWDFERHGHIAIGISFLATPETTDIKLSAEHDAFAWMPPPDIGAYRFAGNLRKEIAWIVKQGWHRPA